MPKGYWIGRIVVHDPEGYGDYVRANAAAFAKYGARFLVRGGRSTPVEGQAVEGPSVDASSRTRLVVLEFVDYETALNCYHSPEYAAAAAIRRRHSTGEIVVVEGYDAPEL